MSSMAAEDNTISPPPGEKEPPSPHQSSRGLGLSTQNSDKRLGGIGRGVRTNTGLHRRSLRDLPAFAVTTEGGKIPRSALQSENMSMLESLPPVSSSMDDQKPTIRARILQWLGLSNMHRDLEERVEARYDSKYTYWLNFVDNDDAIQFDQYCKNKIYPPVYWIFILLVGGIDVSRLSLTRMYEEGQWMQVSSTLSVLTFIVFLIFSLSHFSKLTGINELFWFENISKHITRILFQEQTEDLITILFSLAISSFLVARVLNGPCDNLQQEATAAIDCNPEAVAMSPPTDTVLALYVHPLVLQLAIKGIRKHIMFFSWAVGTTAVSWSIIHAEGWLSIYSILQSLFFLLVIYETQRLKMLVFLQTKYELTIEKKRRQKAELENQLRGEMLEQDRLTKSVHEFEQVSRMARLRELPIHTAIIKYSQDTSRPLPKSYKDEFRAELYDCIKSNIDMHRERDFDGRTALTLLINMETTEVDAITMLLSLSLPIDPDTEDLVPPEEHDYAWTRIVQYERYEPCVKQILKAFPSIGPELAKMEDPEGREAMHIASPKCKKAILSCIYFFRRYEIITLAQPHYQTKTSLVHLAIDHESDDLNKMVALKFLRHRDHFDRECTARSLGNFNDEFVINTLRIHDSDVDPFFREEIVSKGITFFPYCLVMPVGERNLADVMVKEHIAGRDWAEIKVMMTQIACAVGHMHEKGFIHGDLKPLNIMRVAAKMKLIDLDSACECISGLTFAGLKYSSGFVPPEMVYCNETTACVRSESLLKGHDGDSSDRDSDDEKEGFRRNESDAFNSIAGSRVDLLRNESGVFPLPRNGETATDFSATTSVAETPNLSPRLMNDYDNHPILSRTPSSALSNRTNTPGISVGEEGGRSSFEQKDEKHGSTGNILLALEQIDEQKLLTTGIQDNKSLVLASSASRDSLPSHGGSNRGKTSERSDKGSSGGGSVHPHSPIRTRVSDSQRGSVSRDRTSDRGTGGGGGGDTSNHTHTNNSLSNSLSNSRHGSLPDAGDIRYLKRKKERKASLEFDLVPACPAHDLWSLGVVFYQIACNVPLFLCDGDGNIGESDLRILANWSDAVKAEKLSRIKNSLARNLLSIMLNKNPQRRPPIEVVLRHPFLSFHRTTRPEIIVMGEAMNQEFDVFISYRVATDLPHVELLHKLLQNAGLKVWWDKTSLEPGEPWDIAAFRGMLKSKIFIPLVSRGALQRMATLEKTTPCDNMYLEFVLALELRERGTLDKVFPLMLGDKDEAMGRYSKFTFRGSNPCYPTSFPHVVVDSVDAKLRERLDDMELGMPIVDTMTVSEVLAGVMKFQGAYIEGVLEDSFNTIITSKIVPMCKKKNEETKMPSPIPATITATKHGLGINSLPAGGGGIGTGHNTPQGHSRNVSGKESGHDNASPLLRASNKSDRVVTGVLSNRSSGKNDHGHGRSLLVVGNDTPTKITTSRLSFDGAEGSSLGMSARGNGTARSPVFDALRATPSNSDKLRNKRDSLTISHTNISETTSHSNISETLRLSSETNPLSTTNKSLPDIEVEQGVSLHGNGGIPSEATGHILGGTKSVLLGGETTDGGDVALFSPAAAGFSSTASSSKRGVNSLNPGVVSNDALSSGPSSPSPVLTTTTDNNNITIPGLLLSKQTIQTGGLSNSSIGNTTTRGLDSQRGNMSSRNLTKAILGENVGGHAAFHRHSSIMGKSLRGNDLLQNSNNGTMAGGGSGSNSRITSNDTSPRRTSLTGLTIDEEGSGNGSNAPRGSQLGLEMMSSTQRKSSLIKNAAMNAQHMAKLAAGESDDGMSSPRSDDLEEDVDTSLRPKPAGLQQQIHSRALSFMSSFDRTRRSVDAGGGGASTGRAPTSLKGSSLKDKDIDHDQNSNASQKSNGSDTKGTSTARDGATTLRNLFSSLLQQQTPTQATAAVTAASTAAAVTTANATSSTAVPNPLAKARSMKVLAAADGQGLDQLPRTSGQSTVRLATKDNAAMQYQSVRLA